MTNNTTTRKHLTLVPPAMPAPADIDAVLQNRKAVPLADLMAATFASLLKNNPDFAALNSGVDRKTSVHGKLSYDDYEAIKVLKDEADQLGINASDFKGDAWDRALSTLRNRFNCSRSKRKETAKQAALLLAAE